MKLLGRMHYSSRYVQELRQEAIKRNIWFSQEDLAYYKEQRALRDAKEELERKKAEEERIIQEQKEFERAIKEEKKALKALERRNQIIQSRKEEYNKLKRAARQEDAAEVNGRKRTSTKNRNKFFELLIELFSKGAVISEKDIDIMINAMYLHNEFINNKNIKFLIVNAGRTGGFNGAEKMVNELISLVNDAKLSEALADYRKWIRQQILNSKIKSLQEQGFNKEQIAESLNITTAEVIVFGDKFKDSKSVFDTGFNSEIEDFRDIS